MHFLEILKFGNSRRIWVLDHAKNDRLFLSVARVFGHEKCRTHLQAAVECVDALALNLRLNKTNVWKFLENISFSINNKVSIHFLEMCRLKLFFGCSTPVHTVFFGSNQMGHETTRSKTPTETFESQDSFLEQDSVGDRISARISVRSDELGCTVHDENGLEPT